MNAKKCDRCGEFYEAPKSPLVGRQKEDRVTVTTAEDYSFLSFDLCPACMDKQIRFLRGVELKNGPDANQLKAEVEK